MEEKTKKEIVKEAVKIILAAMFCLGVFVFGFITINNLSLAASLDNPEPIENRQANITMPIISEALANSEMTFEDEHFKSFKFELKVIYDPTIGTRNNTMSPYDAAQIGAQHIFDLFEMCISGKTVLMVYSDHPSATRTFWSGTVMETYYFDFASEMRLIDSGLFNFLLDAVTGEFIDILTSIHWMTPSDEIFAALDEYFSNSTPEETFALRSGGPPPVHLDEFIDVVKTFAQKHFNSTTVESIEFRNANALRFDFGYYDNLHVSERQLIFEVTDSAGRIADVAISENGKQLIFILTSSNDIIPGFVYDDDGEGLG